MVTSVLGRVRAILPSFVRERWAVKVGIAILAVLLVVGAISGIIYAQSSSQLSEDSQYRLQTSAETQSEMVSEWSEQMRGQARTITCAEPI